MRIMSEAQEEATMPSANWRLRAQMTETRKSVTELKARHEADASTAMASLPCARPKRWPLFTMTSRRRCRSGESKG